MEVEDNRRHSTLKAFCTKWLQTWTGNRPSELLEFYAKDAYYQDPARPEGLKGHGEIRAYFEKLLAANPEWVWEGVEMIPNDKGFVLKWRATIPTGNGTICTTGLDIVEIRDGKITRNEVYFDPSASTQLERHESPQFS